MTTRLALLAASLSLTAAPALAHHSAALYDRDHPIVLKGTVEDLQWLNPHGWIDVLSNGAKPVRWMIEMEGPIVMQREGWARDSVVPGERVVVRAMPLKDGRPGARLITLTKANGTVLYLFTPRAPGA